MSGDREPTTLGHLGVSLRDYFAAQVLPTMAAHAFALSTMRESIDTRAQRAAYWSYVVADAMLAVRAETPDA